MVAGIMIVLFVVVLFGIVAVRIVGVVDGGRVVHVGECVDIVVSCIVVIVYVFWFCCYLPVLLLSFVGVGVVGAVGVVGCIVGVVVVTVGIVVVYVVVDVVCDGGVVVVVDVDL